MDSTIDALFLKALQIPAGAERDAFLDESCRDNPDMRRRLDVMLADDTAADAFFDGPDTVDSPFARSSFPSEKPGDRIGNYKLLQEIGEGGFGIVYLADQMAPVKRRVALKVLKPGMDTREVVLERFEAERQSLALMDHPNIARIFDGGATESGRPYFVMELVKGIPLTKYCDDQQLNTRQRLDLFLDVLAAVEHAHQKGIIHRDLKPANILVSPHDGRPVIKVIDFGIAKAISMELTEKTLFTAHGRMIGTPQYMSPEQAEVNALDVDTRSDLYSLGVILYELLTGRTPLDAKVLRAAAYAEIQRLIREEQPTKPSTTLKQRLAAAAPSDTESKILNPKSKIPTDLDWIVMKALEKDRRRRYETANGFAADLRRHLENQPVLARPPGAGYLLSRFIRRHKLGLSAGAAVFVAMLAGIAAGVWGIVWGMVDAEVEGTRTKIAYEATKTKIANEANRLFQSFRLASMAAPFPAIHATVVASDSEWKWLHPLNGQDPAETLPKFHQTFPLLAFDDTRWKTGRDSNKRMGGFGYGPKFAGVEIGMPGNPAHRRTAYFRHTFETVKEHSNLELRCQRDDGIIVYLDGKEVGRNNVQLGADAYLLPAAEPTAPESDGIVYRIPIPGTLAPGSHILAISVHNSPKATSTDLRLGGVTLVAVEESKK